MFKGISLFFKEVSQVNKIFEESNDRTLVFYSEGAMFYQYYEGFINYILENSDLEICYLTSEADDPIFQNENKRIKPYYIKNTLNSIIAKLNNSVLVMTMPDIEQFHIKKSNNNVNHLYIFHAIVSTHLTYRLGAFDNYDTVFTVGAHHDKEIRKTEEVYKLDKKELVEVGYPRIEKIFNDHQNYLKDKKGDKGKKNILVAPTWGDGNIIITCIKDIALNLSKDENYNIIIRPHPMTKKRHAKLLKELTKFFKGYENISLELDLTSEVSIHSADILITDWSGIAFEYAFGTERPVLFINTKRKSENNPEYDKLNIEPMDFSLRNKIGKALEINEIDKIKEIADDFINAREEYSKKIKEFRKDYLHNWGNSSKAGGDCIIKLCKEIKNKA